MKLNKYVFVITALKFREFWKMSFHVLIQLAMTPCRCSARCIPTCSYCIFYCSLPSASPVPSMLKAPINPRLRPDWLSLALYVPDSVLNYTTSPDKTTPDNFNGVLVAWSAAALYFSHLDGELLDCMTASLFTIILNFEAQSQNRMSRKKVCLRPTMIRNG